MTRRCPNRDARRAAEQFTAAYRCPDCQAETELSEHAPGVFVLDVRHDSTCPAYQARSREAAQ